MSVLEADLDTALQHEATPAALDLLTRLLDDCADADALADLGGETGAFTLEDHEHAVDLLMVLARRRRTRG